MANPPAQTTISLRGSLCRDLLEIVASGANAAEVATLLISGQASTARVLGRLRGEERAIYEGFRAGESVRHIATRLNLQVQRVDKQWPSKGGRKPAH